MPTGNVERILRDIDQFEKDMNVRLGELRSCVEAMTSDWEAMDSALDDIENAVNEARSLL